MQEMQARFLGREDPLEEEMATHFSIPAWRIPRTEEPGRLQSTGSQSRTRLKRLSTQDAEKYNLPAPQTFRCSSLEAPWLSQHEIRARPGSQMALITGGIKWDKWKLTDLAVG